MLIFQGVLNFTTHTNTSKIDKLYIDYILYMFCRTIQCTCSCIITGNGGCSLLTAAVVNSSWCQGLSKNLGNWNWIDKFCISSLREQYHFSGMWETIPLSLCLARTMHNHGCNFNLSRLTFHVTPLQAAWSIKLYTKKALLRSQSYNPRIGWSCCLLHRIAWGGLRGVKVSQAKKAAKHKRTDSIFTQRTFQIIP